MVEEAPQVSFARRGVSGTAGFHLLPGMSERLLDEADRDLPEAERKRPLGRFAARKYAGAGTVLEYFAP